MAQSVAGRAPPLNGVGFPAPPEATLPNPTATASSEHEHNDDILANLYRCVLEQCRALLVHFRPIDRRPSSPAEVVKNPVPSFYELSEGASKQDEAGVRFAQRGSSDSTLDDIAARIYLWGDVVNTGRAQATSTVSPDLHRTILEVLVECAQDTKRLMKVCSARTGTSAARSSIAEIPKLESWLERVSYILDIGEITEQSDSEAGSHESNDTASNGSITVTQDILESLDESVTLLMSLLPAIDHLSSLTYHVQLDQPSVSLLEVSDPAKLWVSQVRDKYPDAPHALAERLGESNWQRFCRLRIPEDETFAEELGQAKSVFHAPRQAISTFHDSALGSSLAARSDDVKSNASHSSFASSANDSSKHQNRVPPEPPEVAAEKPFTCSICLQNITRVRNRVDWKLHVFNDLQPYVCLDIECRDLLTTFASRKAWAQHDLDSHAQYKTFECHDCDYSCQIESLFDEHISSRHSQLNSKQRTALVAAAARYQHSKPDHRACPLCIKPVVGTFREFTAHVCRHMEDLALGTLPRHMYNDDEDHDDDLASDRSENLPSLHSLRDQVSDEHVEAVVPPLSPSQVTSPRSQTIEVPTSSFEVIDAEQQQHKIDSVPGTIARFSHDSGEFYREVTILHTGDPQSKKSLTTMAVIDTGSSISFTFARVMKALHVNFVPTGKISEFRGLNDERFITLGQCKLFFRYRDADKIYCVYAYVFDDGSHALPPSCGLVLGCDHLVSREEVGISDEGDGAANDESEAGKPLPRLMREDELSDINLQEDEPVQQVGEDHASRAALAKATTQENLAKLASKGDVQGVASILSILERAETEALIAAAKAGHEEILQLLIAMGRPDPDPNPIHSAEMVPGYNTPMLAAIGQGHPDVVRLLSNQAGFNPNRRYRDRTYYELAEERKGEKWEEEYNILKRAYDRDAISKGQKSMTPRREEKRSLSASNMPSYKDHLPDSLTVSNEQSSLAGVTTASSSISPKTSAARPRNRYSCNNCRNVYRVCVFENPSEDCERCIKRNVTDCGTKVDSIGRPHPGTVSVDSPVKPASAAHSPKVDGNGRPNPRSISTDNPVKSAPITIPPRSRYSCINCRNVHRACVYQNPSEDCEQCIRRHRIDCGPKIDSNGRARPDPVSANSSVKPVLTAHSPEKPGGSAVTDAQDLSDDAHSGHQMEQN